MAVKQKSQSSADFLGVLAVSGNVVSGCCIPTTILAAIVPASDIWNPQSRGRRNACLNSRESAASVKVRGAADWTASRKADRFTKKSRSGERCGFPKDGL
jgi:hypothetical protein